MKWFGIILLLAISSQIVATDTIQPPLRGEGEYSWFFMKIYKARLWSYKEGELYSKPVKLELKYLREFSGNDITKQSIKELTSAGATTAELKEFQTKLSAIFPDVVNGDVILADFNPSSGITFYFNSSKELGKIADLNLSKKFLDIWLGEKTNAPQLRNVLLGNKP